MGPLPGGAHPQRGIRMERLDALTRDHSLAVDVLLATVVAVACISTSLQALLTWTEPAGWSVATLAAIAVIHVALVERRRHPLGSFGTITVAMGALAIVPDAILHGVKVPPLMLPTSLVFLVSLYSYCVWGRRPAQTVALTVGALGALAAAIRINASISTGGQGSGRTGLGGLSDFLLLLVALLAGVLAAWSIGLFRRLRFAYVRALEDRAARAEAQREERARRAALDERARIAREMHDVVAHSLAVIVSQAQGGQYAASANPAQAVEVLGTVAETARQALGDMRGLLGVLRPGGGASDAVTGAGTSGQGQVSDDRPQPTLAEIPELLERVRAAGLPVAFTVRGTPGPLGPASELAGFRVVQETLTNTIKHAGAGAAARIRFDWNEECLVVTASDNGVGRTAAAPSGVETAAAASGTGHGLMGMRERVAAVGGSVTAGPDPGRGFGFMVEAHLPYRDGVTA